MEANILRGIRGIRYELKGIMVRGGASWKTLQLKRPSPEWSFMAGRRRSAAWRLMERLG